MIIHRAPQDKPENLDRWLLTYADMITLLTAFFLMLYSMSVMSKGKFQQVVGALRSGFGQQAQQSAQKGILKYSGDSAILPYLNYRHSLQNLSRFVEQNNLEGKVGMHSDEKGITLTLLTDGLLFQSGQDTLQPGGMALLGKVAKILQPLPNQISVEGYTDNLPIHTGQFASNWELSAARAGAVVRYLADGGIPVKRLSAAGYADTRPAAAGDTPQARARNRRVEIVILRSFEEREAVQQRDEEIARITAHL